MSQFRRRVERGRADVDYQESEPITARGGAVLSWAGMRGVVTLAAALTIGEEVEERTLLITVAFFVAVASLLLYGGTLPLLIRRLGVSGVDPDRQRDEVADLFSQLSATATAALGPTDEVVVDGQRIDPGVATEMLAWFDRFRAQRGETTPEALSLASQRMLLHREFISLMRDALHEEQAIGAYSTGALNRASALIDAQELRLER
jgi:CPA1 family monovalent cation:H+ antiporter